MTDPNNIDRSTWDAAVKNLAAAALSCGPEGEQAFARILQEQEAQQQRADLLARAKKIAAV